jgi:hypothetical protein
MKPCRSLASILAKVVAITFKKCYITVTADGEYHLATTTDPAAIATEEITCRDGNFLSREFFR